MYKNILDKYSKAQQYNWNIIQYNRIYDLPETELAKLLQNYNLTLSNKLERYT